MMRLAACRGWEGRLKTAGAHGAQSGQGAILGSATMQRRLVGERRHGRQMSGMTEAQHLGGVVGNAHS